MAPSSSSKDTKSKPKGILSSLFSSSPGARAEDPDGESTTSKKSERPHSSQRPSSSRHKSSSSHTKAPVSEMMPSEAFRDTSKVARSELAASENFRDKSKAHSSLSEPPNLPSEKPWSPKTTMIDIVEVEELTTKHTAPSTSATLASKVRYAIESVKYEDFQSKYVAPSPPPSSRMESVKFEDFKSKYNEPTRPSNPPIATSSRFASASMAPSNVSSMFVDEKDQKMASRQLQIESLTRRDRAEQEKWAQDMISKIGNCPQDFAWIRVNWEHGYQCNGGGHFVSDELLAEGKGGLYLNSLDGRDGPYYADPTTPRQFLYAGPVPKASWTIPDGWRVHPSGRKDMPFYKRKDGSTFDFFAVVSKAEWEREVNRTEEEADSHWNSLVRNARR